MDFFFNSICETHHLILVILALLVAILLGGKVGAVVRSFFKKESPVTVNLKEGDPRICKFSTKDCNEHQAENERSLQNKADIEKLETKVKEIESKSETDRAKARAFSEDSGQPAGENGKKTISREQRKLMKEFGITDDQWEKYHNEGVEEFDGQTA